MSRTEPPATGGLVGLRLGEEPRRDPDAVQMLQGLRTTDLSDATLKSGVMRGIRCVAGEPDNSVIGTAVTVSAPLGGFDIVKMGLALCRPGDVLVINAGGLPDIAVWGGNLSRGARNRGLAAVVVDGAVRDLDEIDELEFPVFARSTGVAAAPVVLPVGEVNVPIACGSTVVLPGDLVIGDSDGVMALRPADAPAVKAAHDQVLAGHQRIRPVLDRGGVTAIAGIMARLEEAGMSIPTDVHDRMRSEDIT